MAKTFIIPNIRSISSSKKESESYFLCPSNCVITGRYHKGDENGQTQYEYSTLKAVDENGNPVPGVITIEDVKWHTALKESSGHYDAPINRVIVGRQHTGDENGKTQYATAVIKFNGENTYITEPASSSAIKESSGIWFKSDSNRVITGRHHSGDENGNTYYYTGIIVTEIDSEVTTHIAEGYTTMTESHSSTIAMYPEGDHYVSTTKIARVYTVTYEIENVSPNNFFMNDSPNCGYIHDPVYGGGFWMVDKGYTQTIKNNKIILTTFCVQLDGKKWYPCQPEDIQWNYLLVNI